MYMYICIVKTSSDLTITTAHCRIFIANLKQQKYSIMTSNVVIGILISTYPSDVLWPVRYYIECTPYCLSRNTNYTYSVYGYMQTHELPRLFWLSRRFNQLIWLHYAWLDVCSDVILISPFSLGVGCLCLFTSDVCLVGFPPISSPRGSIMLH